MVTSHGQSKTETFRSRVGSENHEFKDFSAEFITCFQITVIHSKDAGGFSSKNM